MQPIQLISALALGATTAGADMPKLASDIIAVLDGWVDIYLDDQNHTVGDLRFGQFHKSDNMRMQECTQLIAWAYLHEESRHYGRPEVLNAALWSIDYMVRAQGSNGGFNEYHGWCGAPERTLGKSSVTGFTLYAIGRTIAMLAPLPDMRDRLGEEIDTDGVDGVDTPRLEAWRSMLRAAMEFQYSGPGRGHAPNQDVCALAAVFAMNEAWEALSPEQPPLKSAGECAALRDEILYGAPRVASGRPVTRWFTSTGLLLEPGHGYVGYDSNYGQVTLAFLALCARRDAQVAEFLQRYWSVLEYFYVPDAGEPLGVGMENGISRRSGGGAVAQPSVVSIALARRHHPAGERLYGILLPHFAEGVPDSMTLKSPHHFQITSYLYTEWLDDFGPPHEAAYRLPTERPEACEFRDEEAKTLVRQAENGPMTYYAEEWETSDAARSHVWGQEPEDAASKHLFPGGGSRRSPPSKRSH